MRFWQSVAFTEPEQLVALAPMVEAAGFAGVLVSDHVCHPATLASRYPYSPDGRPAFGPETPWPEPWALIGAMAAVTTRLEFATGVYVLPLRHPLDVAKATSTVAVLSGGRLILGVGVGWMREEFTALGREFAGRGRRTDEAIAVLRKLWAGGMVEHAGRHYRLGPLQISPIPAGPIPVWVGGASARALRRAAVLGDGWIGAGNAPDEVPAIVRRLETLRREAGRGGTPFELVVALTVPVDADAARRLEDVGVTGIVSWPLAYTLGGPSSLDAKRGAIEAYGTDVIARTR